MAVTAAGELTLGTAAPPFKLTDTRTDQHISLETLTGQPVLIVFMCNHCPYVIHLLDELLALTEQAAERGVTTVAISANDPRSHPQDSPERMAALARERQFRFPYCFDETQAVARAYGAACTPEFFLFDAGHQLYYHGQFDSTRPGGQAAHGSDLPPGHRQPAQGTAGATEHLVQRGLQHQVAGLTPTVSVVLPVRCWRPHTAEAIDSIRTQSLRDLEVLIIGQPDTGPLIDRLPDDPRIRLVARPRPGIVAALNEGIRQARGLYIARMDDDDIARPHRLQQQLAHLQGASRTDLCGACVRFVDSDGDTCGIRRGNRDYQTWLNALQCHEHLREAALIECPLPHPTWMAHREVWQQLGPYSEQDLPEDYELLLRACRLGLRLGKPSQTLLDWREHPERLTRCDTRYRREAFAIVGPALCWIGTGACASPKDAASGCAVPVATPATGTTRWYGWEPGLQASSTCTGMAPSDRSAACQ